MKKIPLLFLLFLTINCFSQFSKTHYIPPLTYGTSSGVAPQDHYLYISTPSLTNVSVVITPIGGTPFTLIVNNGTPIEYKIASSGISSQLFIPSNAMGTVINKGYIVEASDLIYTSVRTNAGGGSQAGGLVSKGISGLGKVFRIGAMVNKSSITGLMNFSSVLATENDTHVTITLNNTALGKVMTNGVTYTGPIPITLNKNESYVIALENSGSDFKSNDIIGGLIDSDKNIVVNSGSIGGTNYEPGIIGDITPTSNQGRDIGFDQIVSFEKTGIEYIFIKGLGSNALERVLLIANEDNTQIFINGSATAYGVPLKAGEYLVLDGHDFINENLYVKSDKNIFAYQSIGGAVNTANQNLFFVPPLNCATPSLVDNIPLINKIGNTTYNGTVNIVTRFGATVSINSSPITSAAIPINGNTDYVYYSISGLSGNISVKSTKEVYVSYYGTNNFATYGGYYSGFDIKPEITIDNTVSSTSGCMPNIELKITSDSLNNTFQWVYNGVDIPDEIANSYIPSLLKKGPGYYQVKKSVTSCNSTSLSDEIPVSDCPTDLDGDGVNDNVDIDNDNDGITNCTESYGNLVVPVSNTTGTIAVGNYSNSYSNTTIPTGTGANTISGNTNGSFTTSLGAGNTNSINQKMVFDKPISLGLKYNPTAGTTISSLSNGEFVIKSDTNKTITVLNPSKQLLIDTNYDGIYESDVKEYSSFEIRFRLDGNVLLPSTGTAPAIDFKFQTYLSNSISFTHKNRSETVGDTASFSFYAVCVPKDSDGDGISDQLDTDSDNDGIPDTIEAQGTVLVGTATTDNNKKDGLYDVYGTGLSPIDTDLDGIFDYLDLDSDNDGIKDSVETGNLGTDTDSDGIKNFRELDSDNDGCNDVIEAGFTDPNGDGLLGAQVPPTVDVINGLVTSGTDGYTAPNGNYTTAAPIVILTQPSASSTCELQNTSFSLSDNGGNTYQWQIKNGTVWIDIVNNTVYSGVTTNTLLINSVTNAMNGYKYRVQLSKLGNSCGLTSAETTLIVEPLPIANTVTIPRQCDDNQDGIFKFNTATLENTLLGGQLLSNVKVTYFDAAGNALKDAYGTAITSPFPAEFSTTSQIIKAVVTNLTTLACSAATTIPFVVNYLPEAFAVASALTTSCDDESNPALQDGKISFNTTGFEATILGTQTGMIVKYISESGTPLNSPLPNPFFTATQNVNVNVINPINPTCFATVVLPFIVHPLPILTSPIELKQCDDDIDGKTTFNLTQKNSIISSDVTNTFTYFENSIDAKNGFGSSKILNPIAFVNTIPFNQPIYVRVETIYGCASVGQLDLKISTTTIPASFKRNFSVCDDLTAVPNSDYDGFSVFDFHTVSNDIKTIFLTGTIPYYITYYRNEADALSEINALNQTFPADPLDPTSIYNYRNIGYPNSQKIWVRVDSTIDNSCFGLGPYINLTVEKLPVANPVSIPRQCDDNQDGIFKFDTTSLETTLLNGQSLTNVNITYFDAAGNALKDAYGASISSPFPPKFASTSQIIKAVVTNKTTLACFDETTISFIVDDLPEAFSILSSLTSSCDDETDPLQQDGILNFDTTGFETTILGGQTGMIVKYLDGNGNPLPSPLPNPFTTTTQNVRVEVINPLNQNCTATVVIPFIIHPLPNINLNTDGADDQLVCSNDPSFTVTLDAGVVGAIPSPGFTYQWYWNNNIIPDTAINPSTDPILKVNKEGVYEVEVTNAFGCSQIRTIKVTASDIAYFVNSEIIDLADENTIKVNVTGTGNYVYSMDYDNAYQESPTFLNIAAGIHDIYIKDLNGCGTLKIQVNIMGIPKFFTPNEDGYNDTWNLLGADATHNGKTLIYIFDRYGKLLKEISPLGSGWDGTFIGQALPADDYWYSMKLEDGRESKGHFTLKR